MPVVMEGQTQGLQEINRLTKGEVAGVLKEWQANFANISWLKTLNIMKGPQGYYIVLSADWLSNPFNLYDWLFKKSGERLNPITAMSAMSWEDEDLGFKGTSAVEEEDEAPMQSIGVSLNTPVQEEGSKASTVSTVGTAADEIQQPSMQPVVQQPAMQPVMHPVETSSSPAYTNNPPDDEAVTGFFGGADDEAEQGSPTYAEMQSPLGITVDVYSGRPIVVGRSKKNSNLHLESEGVSRVHAKLQYRDGVLYVTDLGSTNGTYVNGSRLESFKDTPVHTGDTVEFYKELFRVM